MIRGIGACCLPSFFVFWMMVLCLALPKGFLGITSCSFGFLSKSKFVCLMLAVIFGDGRLEVVY